MRKETKQALENLRSGDPISDAELESCIIELEPVVAFLNEAGPIYHLAWKELFFALEQLRQFKEFRERTNA